VAEATTIPTTVQNILAHPDELNTELAKRKLKHYIKGAWNVVEPKTKYKANWHIEAICEHLEAVTNGSIRNLLINIPPRFSKSLTISVFWPTWSWITNPSVRWLFSSYSHTLAVRDSVKSRRILQSNWFQARWGNSFKLSGDQNAKQRYENDQQGYRIATSVGGSATGEGGDYVVVDDPHNVFEVESDTVRESTILWWDEVMSSRLNDQETGCKIIIMQRSHEYDLAGHVLNKGGYEHLNLPMEYEAKCIVETKHSCSQQDGTSIGYTDPRTNEGELLSPTRMGEQSVRDIRRDLGSYAYAGQYQQKPTAREGNMFRVDEFHIVDSINEKNVKKEWRSWDKAGTEGAGDYTVGVRMGKYRNPRGTGVTASDGEQIMARYFVRDVVRGQWSTGQREAKIKRASEIDGKSVWITIEQEPGSGGKESAEASLKNLVGRHVEIDTVSGEGNKEKRADPYSVAVENGEVDLLAGPWLHGYIEEHRHFPQSRYKDQVDASARAFNKLKTAGRVHVG